MVGHHAGAILEQRFRLAESHDVQFAPELHQLTVVGKDAFLVIDVLLNVDLGRVGIDLGAGDDRGQGRNGADTLLGGEGADNLRGNNGDDYLLGGSGNDTIYGNAGNDTVVGGDCYDKLNGGSGDNTLEGGDGSDKFVIIEGNTVITDFDAGEDDVFYFENQSDSEILESFYRWFESDESATGLQFSVSDGGLTVTVEAGSLYLENVTIDNLADWYELG
ncbi:calcium-binding protein [Yangia sp. PrR004]|nr:calcium-binding protein [Salipiger sp. PrR004]